MILYHYTTKDACDEIIKTRKFGPSFFSTTLDSTYGQGWYFTDLSPLESDKVLYQLWGGPEPERVDNYLKFEIDNILLRSGRSHVFRLPLETITGGVIDINLEYQTKGITTIKFLGAFKRTKRL